MSWFRKKEKSFSKAIPVCEVIKPPTVIKESLLKPITCKFCKSIYSGTPANLNKDLIYFNDQVKPRMSCPVCGYINDVEFEEDTDGMS